MRASWWLFSLLWLAACGDDDGGTVVDAPDAGGLPADGGLLDGASLVEMRPYDLRVPTGLVPGTPAPLLILLHGYTASGSQQEAYFQLGTLADAEGFLYATPDGTIDTFGARFWNATDACCDLGDTGVDDVAYVNAIIDDVGSRYTVDPLRVYAVGHSNGGFMAHRLACDASARFAAVVSLAGATFKDESLCDPTEPVSILQIHGTLDDTIRYDGDSIATVAYPGAVETVETWAAKNGCTGTLADTHAPLDLESALAGEETTVERTGGCPADGAVELWTIEGGSHIPTVAHPAWETSIWSFLEAHPKAP